MSFGRASRGSDRTLTSLEKAVCAETPGLIPVLRKQETVRRWSSPAGGSVWVGAGVTFAERWTFPKNPLVVGSSTKQSHQLRRHGGECGY